MNRTKPEGQAPEDWTGFVAAFQEALLAGNCERCATMLRAKTTDRIQGLEYELLRARRSGAITEA